LFYVFQIISIIRRNLISASVPAQSWR